MYEGKLGRNWSSTFNWRHKDELHSGFYAFQEAARLKANTPETRQAFYALVGHFKLNASLLTHPR